jgi:hypothetical protein
MLQHIHFRGCCDSHHMVVGLVRHQTNDPLSFLNHIDRLVRHQTNDPLSFLNHLNRLVRHQTNDPLSFLNHLRQIG